MAYDITKKIISGLPKKAYRHGVGAYEGVVAHSTDNPEATAANNAAFESTHWDHAFVHFFVDWTSIIQVSDTDYLAWGAGSAANPRFIHIELCETKDPDKFKDSYDRYVWLSAYILKQKNLGVTDGETLWSHAEVSQRLGGTNHQDPISYLASHDVSWDQHVDNVKAAYELYYPKPVQPPVTKVDAASTSIPKQVQVLVKDLNLRDAPSLNGKVIKKLTKGYKYKVYAVKDGWYDLGANLWAYGNDGKYLKEL